MAMVLKAGYPFSRPVALAALVVAGLALPIPSLADGGPYRLAPLTKLHLTVVQFMPATGDYRRWDAIGGDITVSPDGTVTVPVLGSIAAAGMTADELGAEVAGRLQERLGLVDRPDATVAILDYPPIYLVGNVQTPGQYQYRPGMTVLQAVALAGGQFRSASDSSPSDTIRLQSDLQGNANDTLRTRARIARLEAELSGADTITFPPELGPDGTDPGTVAAITGQETVIFNARRNELTRQTKALDDLSALFKAEIDVLDQKSKGLDEQIAVATDQLSGVKQLVDKGIATVSRRTDLERALAGLRSDRLDTMIATMQARQQLSEAMRNQTKLEDDRRADVSMELQTEQANLEKLRLQQSTTLRMLHQATLLAASEAATEAAEANEPVFTIIRGDGDGGTMQMAANEATVMEPGDLLKVELGVGESARTGPAGAMVGQVSR